MVWRPGSAVEPGPSFFCFETCMTVGKVVRSLNVALG